MPAVYEDVAHFAVSIVMFVDEGREWLRVVLLRIGSRLEVYLHSRTVGKHQAEQYWPFYPSMAFHSPRTSSSFQAVDSLR